MQTNAALVSDSAVDEAEMRGMSSRSSVAKYASLLCLTFQNVALIITMKYSRSRQGDKYIMTTAVVMSEMVKLLSCLLVILVQERSYKGWLKHLYVNILKQPGDCLKISVPGVVYMVQNNLLYVAVANLEATTFQVVYQLKILTTALFSVSMLGKKLSRIQWSSLVVLFAGVSLIVHLQTDESKSTSGATPVPADGRQWPFAGLVAVLVSCILSGFAGVYYEKLLKNTPQSLYLRNVQLGAFGVFTGLGAVVCFDREDVLDKGFFFGYDELVVILILLQSLGGIIVAVVVKYADNILKGFATSAAIVLSCVVSVFFFDFVPSFAFLFASGLVVGSVYMYNQGSLFPSSVPSHAATKRIQEVV